MKRWGVSGAGVEVRLQLRARRTDPLATHLHLFLHDRGRISRAL